MIRDGQEGFGMKQKKVFLKKVIDERQEAELNRLLSGGYHLVFYLQWEDRTYAECGQRAEADQADRAQRGL